MNAIEELSTHESWNLLRQHEVARLAVWVEDHPDIFPLNYAVDQGTIVFRSGPGTKVSAALSEYPVALEIDGFDADTGQAWSIVVKGSAEPIQEVSAVMDTVDLVLNPWQDGQKNLFVRIVPTSVTGRRFQKVDPGVWQTSLSQTRRAATE